MARSISAFFPGKLPLFGVAAFVIYRNRRSRCRGDHEKRAIEFHIGAECNAGRAHPGRPRRSTPPPPPPPPARPHARTRARAAGRRLPHPYSGKRPHSQQRDTAGVAAGVARCGAGARPGTLCTPGSRIDPRLNAPHRAAGRHPPGGASAGRPGAFVRMSMRPQNLLMIGTRRLFKPTALGVERLNVLADQCLRMFEAAVTCSDTHPRPDGEDAKRRDYLLEWMLETAAEVAVFPQGPMPGRWCRQAHDSLQGRATTFDVASRIWAGFESHIQDAQEGRRRQVGERE